MDFLRRKMAHLVTTGKEADKHGTSGVIQVPALGRPFRLGMLYDLRREMIHPGESLWSAEILKKCITSTDHKGCKTSICSGESMEEKMSSLDLDGNMKLSLLLGKVSVGCSGKYLKDSLTANDKVSMSLICDYTTHYREMTLPEVDNYNTLEHTDATHVVVAIQYGTKVVFTFERTLSKSENKISAEGELRGKIDSMASASFEGSGKMKSIEGERKQEKQISCRFSGDYIPSCNPTTYDEAVELYKTLPSNINKDISVPTIVWLQPLSTLKGKEYEHISLSSLNATRFELLFAKLHDIIRKSDDYLKNFAGTLPADKKDAIQQFIRNIKHYVHFIKEQLQTALTDATYQTETIFTEHFQSPFGDANLDKWLNTFLNETNLLNQIEQDLLKDGIRICDDYDLAVKKYTHDRLILFRAFLPLHYKTVLLRTESYIRRLYDMQNDENIQGQNEDKQSEVIYERTGFWYNDDNILLRLSNCVSQFKKFRKSTRQSDIVCAAQILFQHSNDSTRCVKFEYYSGDKRKRESYEAMTVDEISEFVDGQSGDHSL